MFTRTTQHHSTHTESSIKQTYFNREHARNYGSRRLRSRTIYHLGPGCRSRPNPIHTPIKGRWRTHARYNSPWLRQTQVTFQNRCTSLPQYTCGCMSIYERLSDQYHISASTHAVHWHNRPTGHHVDNTIRAKLHMPNTKRPRNFRRASCATDKHRGIRSPHDHRQHPTDSLTTTDTSDTYRNNVQRHTCITPPPNYTADHGTRGGFHQSAPGSLVVSPQRTTGTHFWNSIAA